MGAELRRGGELAEIGRGERIRSGVRVELGNEGEVMEIKGE